MREIASERNTTTFFPLPIELLGPIFNAVQSSKSAPPPQP
jgi:hypothetical protein